MQDEKEITAKDLSWRSRLHQIIYESDTTAGKLFDIVLLLLIIASIITVMLDSIESYRAKYGRVYYISSGSLHCYLQLNTFFGSSA
jgi:voltage-gated potassium channel